LGNGDGTFQPPVNYGAGSNPSAAGADDFNGDGKLDLAVANYGGHGNVASFSVLLGNGNGTFQSSRLSNMSASACTRVRWPWEISTTTAGSTW
jgi:FG-GAP-like repeat